MSSDLTPLPATGAGRLSRPSCLVQYSLSRAFNYLGSYGGELKWRLKEREWEDSVDNSDSRELVGGIIFALSRWRPAESTQ
jgi:hypothetical protein